MDFDKEAFTRDLVKLFRTSELFPYLHDPYVNPHNGATQKDSAKHPKRSPTHLKEVVEQEIDKSILSTENTTSFDLGSERLEREYPYYHILENTLIIRKRNRGTKKTKGSQETISDLGKRDYELVHWNGKTFTKEYSRNVRGARNRVGKVSHWENGVFVNRESNSYHNEHYRYIEKILASGILDQLAEKYGLKLMKRTQDTGLGDEYSLQPESEYTQGLLDTLESFN